MAKRFKIGDHVRWNSEAGRVSGTNLLNPDFVTFAQAFGAHAERVENDADFPAAFERARASGKAAVIELCTDPLQIGPQSRLAKR